LHCFRLRNSKGLQIARGHGGKLRRRRLDAGENEDAAEERSEERTDTVERLRQIEPRRRGLRRPQHGDERIGRGFEKGQAESDDVQRSQKECERAQLCSRVEQDGADEIEREPDEDAVLVT
jgi:hypothetical protein